MFINKSSTASSIDFIRLFEDGIIYINTEQWLFAYNAFTALYQNSKTKSVALLYNFALCHSFAKEYKKAIEILTEALNELATPSTSYQFSQNLSSEIINHEFDGNQYRFALNETAVELNANNVKLRIRRLLVDIHLALENWQEVSRLSALPEMDKCRNVQEAIAILKSKMNH